MHKNIIGSANLLACLWLMLFLANSLFFQGGDVLNLVAICLLLFLNLAFSISSFQSSVSPLFAIAGLTLVFVSFLYMGFIKSNVAENIKTSKASAFYIVE